jgi:hypothetical protein
MKSNVVLLRALLPVAFTLLAGRQVGGMAQTSGQVATDSPVETAVWTADSVSPVLANG